MLRTSGYYFVLLLAGGLAAFWPRYISRPLTESDVYTHVHAYALVAWCGLLIAQPFLIRGDRRAIHRALGVASYVIAPVVMLASLLLAHARFRVMDEATFIAEARNLYLPLSAVVLFAIAYALGVWYRRRAQMHGRFMICTGLPMIDPVLGRIMAFYFAPLPEYLYYQAITFGTTDAILLWLALRDRRHPQVRWLFPSMLGVFAAAHALWFTYAQSAAWLPFAWWFRRLPLT